MKLSEFRENDTNHKYATLSIEEFVGTLPDSKYDNKDIEESVKDSFYSLCKISPPTSRYLRETYLDLINEMSLKIASREEISLIHLLTNDTHVTDLVPSRDHVLTHREFLDISERELEDYFLLSEVVLDPLYPSRLHLLVLQLVSGTEGSNLRLGYIITNDEVHGVSARIVVKTGRVLLTLPAKHGTYSTGRYMKGASDIREALSILYLRIREESIGDKFDDITGLCHIVLSDDTKMTCEEYSKILNNFIVSLSAVGITDQVDFKDLSIVSQMVQKYGTEVEELMTKYLWRCTAVSDNTLGDLLDKISRVYEKTSPDEVVLDPHFMSEVGSVIFSERLLKEIASEKE